MKAFDRAFTLIEMVLVMGIVSLLAVILFPQVQRMQQRAQSVVCVNNLRQLGIILNGYLGDHNGFYPEVEPAPGESIYQVVGKNNVPGLQELFSTYGATQSMLRCPTDATSSSPYYLNPIYQSSYEWRPIVDDESTVDTTVLTRFGPHTVPSRRIRLVTDIAAVHFGKMNALFADGHVILRTK